MHHSYRNEYKFIRLVGPGFQFIEPKYLRTVSYVKNCTVKMANRLRRDLSLSYKVTLLDKIVLQPPRTSHRWLVEVFAGPKSMIDRLVRNENELCKQLLEKWAQ